MNGRHHATRSFTVVTLILTCAFLFSPARSVSADVNQPGPNYTVTTTAANGDGLCSVSECTLREAIVAANADGASSVIDLQGTVNYELSDFVDATKGQTAFPVITTPITIHGNGSSIIRPDTLTCDVDVPNEPWKHPSSAFFTSLLQATWPLTI